MERDGWLSKTRSRSCSWKSVGRRGTSRVNWQKEGLKATPPAFKERVSSLFSLFKHLLTSSGHLTFPLQIFAARISHISSDGGTFQRAVISLNFPLIRSHLHPRAQVTRFSFIFISYIFFSSFRHASHTFISTLSRSHLHLLLLLQTA